jgi:uncharacterized protein YybS (DUF2232 family)
MGRLNRIKRGKSGASKKKEPKGPKQSPLPALLILVSIAMACAGLVWGTIQLTARIPEPPFMVLASLLFVGGLGLMVFYFKKWGAI